MQKQLKHMDLTENYSGKSHVGMAQCFLCHEDSFVLLDKRLRNTLPRHCGVVTTEPCGACAKKIEDGYVGLLLTTEAAIKEVEEDAAAFRHAQHRDPSLRRTKTFIPDFNPRSFGVFMEKEALFASMDDSQQMRDVRRMADRDGWIVMLGDAFVKMGGLEMLPNDLVASLKSHGIVSADVT